MFGSIETARPSDLPRRDLDGDSAGSGSPWAFLGIFALALAPIVLTPILPTLDFYNHVARYFVLAHLETDPGLQQHYATHWSILPNVGLDVLGAGLLRFVNPMLGGHIIAVSILAMLYSGVLFFSRQVTGRLSPLTALLTLPLLYSFIFTWGFANFLFGLGLTFWGAGAWLALRHRPILATGVGCTLALVIFACHGLAFALYGLLLGGLELGRFFALPRRRVTTLLGSGALLSLQALAPGALFLASATAGVATGVTDADESISRLIRSGHLFARVGEQMAYRLQTIVRVAEGPSLAFDLASMAASLALLAILARRGRVSLNRRVAPALVIAVALVAFTPPTLFGVGYVADRMPLYLALIAVGGLTFRPGGERFDRLCQGALIALVAVRIIWISFAWRPYGEDFAQFRVVAAQIPPGRMVAFLTAPRPSRLDPGLDPERRCEMYGPLLVALYGQAAPLFADSTQQPLRIIGRLRTAIDDLESAVGPDPRAVDTPGLEAQRAVRSGQFDYLMICRSGRHTTPFPPGATVVSQAGRFSLLRTIAR